jgi:hypothetical protein
MPFPVKTLRKVLFAGFLPSAGSGTRRPSATLA